MRLPSKFLLICKDQPLKMEKEAGGRRPNKAKEAGVFLWPEPAILAIPLQSLGHL